MDFSERKTLQTKRIDMEISEKYDVEVKYDDNKHTLLFINDQSNFNSFIQSLLRVLFVLSKQ